MLKLVKDSNALIIPGFKRFGFVILYSLNEGMVLLNFLILLREKTSQNI